MALLKLVTSFFALLVEMFVNGIKNKRIKRSR